MSEQKYCDEHSCIKNEIDHLKEDNREIKQSLSKIKDEIKALSTHEKIYIAFIGFAGVALSAGGSVLGTLIVKAWGQ